MEHATVPRRRPRASPFPRRSSPGPARLAQALGAGVRSRPPVLSGPEHGHRGACPSRRTRPPLWAWCMGSGSPLVRHPAAAPRVTRHPMTLPFTSPAPHPWARGPRASIQSRHLSLVPFFLLIKRYKTTIILQMPKHPAGPLTPQVTPSLAGPPPCCLTSSAPAQGQSWARLGQGWRRKRWHRTDRAGKGTRRQVLRDLI